MPDNKVVTLGYTGVRKLTRAVSIATSASSEAQSTTTETYDRQGRLYKVKEPSGSGGGLVTTTYSYDVGNRLHEASTTSGATQNRTYTYDNRGLLQSEDVPEKTAGVTYSSYDARGHAGRVVDGPNDLTFTYDKAERVANVKVTGASSSLTEFVYDKLNGNAMGSSLGKLVRATRHNWVNGIDNPVVETYTYSGIGGRVSDRTTSVDGKTFDQAFTWDELGLQKHVGYPQLQGSSIHGLLGTGPIRKSSYYYTNGFLTGVAGFATSISYHPNMMVDQITLGNDVTISEGMATNDMQRVTSIGTSGVSQSNNWTTGTYAYDGAGNIKTIGTLHFIYDKVSRLTSGQVRVGGATKTQSAVYDAFGNITQTTTTQWGTQSFSLSSSTNRLSWPASYDSAGHLTHWGSISNGYNYTYNGLGQLQTATGTSLNHTYLYTASGERIADRNALNDTTTLTLRGLDGRLLRTYLETGTSGNGDVSWVEDEVWGGGRLLGTISPTEGKRYYAVDHLGTPRLVCDRCKDRKAQHDYYAFGLEASDPTQDAEPTRFTSQETDLQNTSGQADDLVNMHARFYHPLLTRFLSADLLSGNPHSPQSFNLFAYVRGNPANYLDPYGLHIIRDPWDAGTFYEEIWVTDIDPWRTAAEGWQSRDEFMNGTPTNGLAPGGNRSLREAFCYALPSGRTIGVSGTFGGIGPSGGGGEIVINFNSGQVSAFGFGVVGLGWNGGVQGSLYSGYVAGLSDDNSNYTGGFTGANLSVVSPALVGAGVFGAASSEGLGGLGKGHIPWPQGPPVVGGVELTASSLPGVAGAITAATYSEPVQLGRFWAFALHPQDLAFYVARKVLCK